MPTTVGSGVKAGFRLRSGGSRPAAIIGKRGWVSSTAVDRPTECPEFLNLNRSSDRNTLTEVVRGTLQAKVRSTVGGRFAFGGPECDPR